MNVALVLLSLGISASAPGAPQDPLGVVRVTRGRVTLTGGAGSTPVLAASGVLLHRGVIVETGGAGWAELLLLDGGSVSLSAGTRVILEPDGLALDLGRVLVRRAEVRGCRSYPVTAEEARAEIPCGATVVVERSRTGGASVYVRSGSASLARAPAAGPPASLEAQGLEVGAERGARIERGRVATLPPGARAPSPARPGGAGVEDLVGAEADSNLGDVLGVRALLLERAASAGARSATPRGSTSLRGEAEVGGGSPAAVVLESAIKPAPFFEQEVPPKGPNVRVEVTFGEE